MGGRELPVQGPADCGPASLVYAARRLGLNIPLAAVRLECGTDEQGTTVLGLVRAADRFGLVLKAVRMPDKASINHAEIPLPFIAHGQLANGQPHFVTVIGCSAKGFDVYDPEMNRRVRWSRTQFEGFSSGIYLLPGLTAGIESSGKGADPTGYWLRLLAGEGGVVARLALCAILMAVLALGMSIFVQLLIDRVLPEQDRRLLWQLGWLMLGIVSLQMAVEWLQHTTALRFAQRLDLRLISSYYRHLLKLPQLFFDSMRVGDLLARIGDATRVRAFLQGSLTDLLIQPLFLLVAMGWMFIYSWQIALLALGLIPLYAVVYAVVHQLNKNQQRKVIESGAHLESKLAETLHGHALTRVAGQEGWPALRTESALVQMLRAVRAAAYTQIGIGMFSLLLTQVFGLGLLWYGASLCLDGRLSPGQLMSCFTLSAYITGPVIRIISLNAHLREAAIAAERLFQIMDLECVRQDGPIVLQNTEPVAVRCVGLNFAYPGKLPVIKNFNAEFAAGAIHVITGTSGCGKSTLLSLLQGHYAPDGGEIVYGDYAMHMLHPATLRSLVCVTPQEPVLFSGTLLDNCTLLNPQAEPAVVLQLAQALGLGTLLSQHSSGLLQPLQERGRNLSGGQKQRVALVRMLVSGAPVWIMDEPTAALDSTTEQVFLQLLQRYRDAGVTIIAATHSQAFVKAADQIFSMD